MSALRARLGARSLQRRTHRRPVAQAPNLTPASLLQLIWLASPALPVGGFSYSEVLEAAVNAGLTTTEPDTSRWLLDQLHLGLARSDLALVARAHGAWQRGDVPEAAALNTWVLTTRESHELRQ
ncbi:MAG: urease accessory protein UreF, partial [Burkholderiaceae bacterium]|nr:urease accessory protein UreF [Burkholderiaceae bacterium]